MFRIVSIPGLVLFLLSGGCAAEDRYQRILNHVDSPGAQLSVTEADGGTWGGATGDRLEDWPVTSGSAFLIGSNTKVLTAAVVLQLVQEGALSLDDSASTWVPQLDPAITVRNLLQHTSGLGEYNDHDTLTANDGEARAWVWAPEDLVDLGQQVRDDGPQSTGVYANTNYVALGLVVEAVDGVPYGEALTARIFEPLGMERSGLLEAGSPIPTHLAFGDGGAWDEVTWVDASTGWAAGSGYASAADLSRFYTAMRSGELFGEDLVRAQREAVTADLGFDDPNLVTSYGLGLMVVEIGEDVYLGHLGKVAGFTAMVMEDEQTGAASVLLTNASDVDFIRPSMKALKVAGKR